MMFPNTQKATSTIMRARDCRSPYSRRRELGEVLDLNVSKLTRQRLRKSRTVERVAEARLPTEFGEFRIVGYRSLTSNEEFVVLARGELREDRATLVRIHSQCLTGDVFGSVKCDCGRQLRAAMQLIAREGRGAIVYQQQEGRGIGIINKIRAYALQDKGADTIEANERLGLAVDLRCYEQCAEILRDLGLNRVRLMSNNPEKMRALEGMGLDVVERVALMTTPTDAAKNYLRTKKEKMGHLLELV
jgi:3,4-dihydroxy 2-butanone 4-phosphate synthase/GTP cyclohydrolase II